MFRINIYKGSIFITIGYKCGDGLDCNKYKKCKYRARFYKLQNMSVSIHRFFEYKLHIKLPHLIYIDQEWKRLSGTAKCPFHRSRNYTCYDCKYVGGNLLRDCLCEERNNTNYKERAVIKNEWGQKCAYFEKCDWADDYKTK